MGELRVTSWKRYGHDRLYVNLPDGTAVVWMDCKTGEITIKVPAFRQAAMDALATHSSTPAVPSETTPPASTPPLPPLPPEFDLATRRPGAGLKDKLDTSGPSRLERVLAWLLRRPDQMESWRTGLVAEKRVGVELERLGRQGWRVLHSVPLPRNVDIDHLLIGPGGVFSINTKNHPGKSVWVGDGMVRVNRGRARPYPLKSKAEARRVQRVLEARCDFAVQVQPVLVFVGLAKLDVVPTQLDVRVYREREVAALGPLNGVFDTAQVERVYDVARDSRIWKDA
ncbi:nuclease-related domain-containing protein [Streptomyces sp. PR69]|uniref:nuclease-related domain-containing protein n=1 Tax=Streptomyces sp. PR69 TaxID=2984950 RepID=UPI002265454E|nr:nuclease-related domain-containing protein [Streptomyces sp. PR69]